MLFGSDCNNNMLRDVTKVKRGETVGLSSATSTTSRSTGRTCCIASVSSRALCQNVCRLPLSPTVQGTPDLLRGEWRVDVAYPDAGQGVHDGIGHGYGRRHRR